MTPTADEQLRRLTDMLERFAHEEDQSKTLAGQIEVALDEMFGDDKRFEDLILALASYEPGGGVYLFDAPTIRMMCQKALTHLKAIE